jgi:hypothetical protein
MQEWREKRVEGDGLKGAERRRVEGGDVKDAKERVMEERYKE